jgi:hypothetical protein
MFCGQPEDGAVAYIPEGRSLSLSPACVLAAI